MRFLPQVFKINAVYEFLVCPYLSVWFRQTIYKSKPFKKILYLFFFSIPQGLFEILLEKETNMMSLKGIGSGIISFTRIFSKY